MKPTFFILNSYHKLTPRQAKIRSRILLSTICTTFGILQNDMWEQFVKTHRWSIGTDRKKKQHAFRTFIQKLRGE